VQLEKALPQELSKKKVFLQKFDGNKEKYNAKFSTFKI
jgi:hypothetical protein